MKTALKIMLGVIFLGVAIVMVYYPRDTKAYFVQRYSGFRGMMRAVIILPAGLISEASTKFVFILAGVMVCAAFCILAGRRYLMVIIAYFTALIGGLLHLPYSTGTIAEFPAQQCRKLLFVLATFCSLLILAGEPCPAPCKSTSPVGQVPAGQPAEAEPKDAKPKTE